MKRNIASLCACLVAALFLSACSLAPKYERPDQELPAAWKKVDLGTLPLDTDWWKRFNDPVLTALIEQALRNNQDLAASVAKIKSAAAQAGVGSAALVPVVSADGSAMAAGDSEKRANSTPFSRSGLSRWTTTYKGALSAAWELDFFGAARNQYTALTDILLQTVVGHEASRLAISSQVAQSYFSLLALDMQLSTAQRTLRTREDALKIYTSRYRQGDITELDWQRAKSECESARAQVHSSTMAVNAAESSLAVLTGRSPREIMTGTIARGSAIERLVAAPVIPAGLPSDLLERRPDIRAAEYALMASNAQIGVARAQFFPSISLTGALGTLSAGVGSLFTGPAATWSYGVTGTLPIFDLGRTWYLVKDAEAKKEQAIAVYRKTVQEAFSDVRISLTNQTETEGVLSAMKASVESLRRSVEIARLQYTNGYTDYLTVLDAERALFSAELSLANAYRDRLSAVVSVCMALGGGWKDPNVRPTPFLIDEDKLIESQRGASAALQGK